jgi:hypothetical protein
MASAFSDVLTLSELDPTTIVFEKPKKDNNGMIIPIKRTDGKPLLISSPEVKEDVPDNWCFMSINTFSKDK